MSAETVVYRVTGLVTLGYFLVLAALVMRAWRHPAQRGHIFRPLDAFRPHVFSEQGRIYLRRANRFCVLGGVLVAVCWLIAWLY
jgi:hypothetical protein